MLFFLSSLLGKYRQSFFHFVCYMYYYQYQYHHHYHYYYLYYHNRYHFHCYSLVIYSSRPEQAIRELQILRRGRLRVRDFLNTEYSSRVNQRHFGGKKESRRHSTTNFSENVVLTETSYKVLEVLSFCGREMAQAPSVKITVLIFW